MNKPFATISRWLFTMLTISLIGLTAADLLAPVPFALSLVIGIPGFFLPGLLLTTAFRRSRVYNAQFFTYASAFAVAYWLSLGLLLNTLLPSLGIIHPLASLPVTLTYAASNAILLILAYRNYTPVTIERSPQPLDVSLGLVGLGLPVLCLIGTMLLNNNVATFIPAVMITAIGIYILALVVWNKRLNPAIYPFSLFLIALTLLLMYSLRSWHLVGWDVHKEFQVFQLTQQQWRWQMSSLAGDSYNACLSITILPTLLGQLVHTSAEYIFKFTTQFIFSFIALGVYAIAVRYVSPVKAFLASALFISQNWFFEQMPALTRQEYGFMFFTALLLLLLDNRLTSRTKTLWFYVFTFGLIVSHYSTAYVWIALLVIATLGTKLAKWISPRLRGAKSPFRLHYIAASMVMVFLWEGPITNSTAHATQFASSGKTNILSSLTPTSITQGIQAALTPNDQKAASEKLTQAVAALNTEYRLDGYDLYPAATYAGYTPTILADHTAKPTSAILRAANTVTAVLAKAVKLALQNLLPLVGLITLCILALRQRGAGLELPMLGAAGYIIIAAMIAAPFLQEYYNLTRLSLQMLVVLGLASIIGAAQVLKRFGHNGTFITAAMIALSLFASVGLTGIWSGKLQTIELATQADAKDKYYVTDPEAAAATWLKTLRPGTTVYADALAALQLQAYANITTYDTVVLPSITSRDSYVYVDSANLNRQTGYLEYDNNTLTYNFPLDFLDEQKDIIYSNNSARVYH